jgi:glycosyltransferase involved in cell wall biosynthesis
MKKEKVYCNTKNMKKDSRNLVFGNFDYLENNLNGQTVKTRTIYDVLKKNEKIIGEVCFFDDRELLRKKTAFISLIIELIKCKRLIYIPALNNLRYFLPLIYCISKLFDFKIILIPVGGRNNDFLNKNKLHRLILSKIHVNLPQVRSEVNELKVKYNYTNVSYLPNFRIHKFNPVVEINNSVDFKICFMARITPLKGVNSVIRLANSLLSNPINNRKIKIDFYGPIDNEFKKEFLEKINTNSIINYLGILKPKDIYMNLSKYDVLVLPTK